MTIDNVMRTVQQLLRTEKYYQPSYICSPVVECGGDSTEIFLIAKVVSKCHIFTLFFLSFKG